MGSYKLACNQSCISEVKVRLKGNIIREVMFNGGCSCIFQTLNQLIIDRDINEVISLLKNVDFQCVNKESCIKKLLTLLEKAKVEEEKRQEELNEYRLLPPGFYKSFSLLASKPNIDYNKKFILVKVHTDLYDKLYDSISKLPEYIFDLRDRKNKDFDNKISEILDEEKRALKLLEKKNYNSSLDNILQRVDELKIEKNDEFDGDYIFNTVYKEEYNKE